MSDLPPTTVMWSHFKLESSTDEFDTSQSGIKEETPVKGYCAECDRKFASRSSYRRHIIEKHEKTRWQCPFCPLTFTRKDMISRQHIPRHHPAEARFYHPCLLEKARGNPEQPTVFNRTPVAFDNRQNNDTDLVSSPSALAKYCFDLPDWPQCRSIDADTGIGMMCNAIGDRSRLPQLPRMNNLPSLASMKLVRLEDRTNKQILNDSSDSEIRDKLRIETCTEEEDTQDKTANETSSTTVNKAKRPLTGTVEANPEIARERDTNLRENDDSDNDDDDNEHDESMILDNPTADMIDYLLFDFSATRGNSDEEYEEEDTSQKIEESEPDPDAEDSDVDTACKDGVFSVAVESSQKSTTGLPTETNPADEQNEVEKGISTVKCPSCPVVTPNVDLISNLFLGISPATSKENESATEKDDSRVCTGCEDNIVVTSFCLECSEYLCDQCVQAHRRVRVTKDHTIQSKDLASPNDSLELLQPAMLCPIHKQEPLKLYCETCEKLTCRDCQLLGHKDHKYQFVDEAADNYKKFLASLLDKIREKKNYVENAKSLIESRHSEITEKERKVAQDIKTFIMKVAQELNKRGKQLMSDLQNVCKAKKGQLESKNLEVQGLSRTLSHTLKFAEYSLEKGNNAALMYTRKTLNNQMRDVLKIRCEVPNPYHIIDLKFGYDPKTPLVQIPVLGSIFVEGVPFNCNNSAAGTATNGSTQSPTSIAQQINHVSQPPSQASSHNNRHNTGYHLPTPEELQNLSSQQRAMIMMKMKKMQDQQQHRAGGIFHPQPNPMYNRPTQQSTSPSSSTGMSSLHMLAQMQQHQMGGGSQHLTHLPHQSSCISSSNGQHMRNAQYYPPPLKGPHPIQHPNVSHPQLCPESLIQINLSQLQDRRNQHAHAPHQQQSHQLGSFQQRPNVFPPNGPNHPTNMQNPIVIQPQGTSEYTDIMSQTGRPQSDILGTNQLSDCMHSGRSSQHNTNINKAIKPEETFRPSCSFAASNCKKAELLTPTTPDNDTLPGPSNQSSGSRTPTPRAESTTTSMTPNDRPPRTESVTPDLDMIANSNTTDDFLSFLINNTDTETMASPESRLMVPPLTSKSSGKDVTGKELSQPRAGDRNPDDPSEDWCAVCHNGGDLLCCDTCPKVFHLTCHVPTIPDFPSSTDDWSCGLCVKADQLLIETEPEKKDDIIVAMSEQEVKVCERILLELFSYEDSGPFHEPVSPSVPNYYKIISRPMDLGGVKKKLEDREYHSVEGCLKDIQLVFSNCATYNLPDSIVGKIGSAIQKYFTSQLKRYVPYITPASLISLDDSQEISQDTLASIVDDGPPAKKKKRMNSEDTDEDWTADSQETDEEPKLKRKSKRISDEDSTESQTDSEQAESTVHIC